VKGRAIAALVLLAAAAPASADDEGARLLPDAPGASMAQAGAPAPVPRAGCGPGSNPTSGMSGQVPRADVEAGRGADGFTCNTQLLGRHGVGGGFKVERFVDQAGRECAYYDTTLLFPTNPSNSGSQEPASGVAVLDMSDPSKPVETARLRTPAMESPHESVLVNQKRGLLAAVLGNPGANVGIVDIYDLNEDCRNPELMSSSPVGVLGHESGFSPDGNTFWATSLFNGSIVAVDVSNPRAPVPVWYGDQISHGLTISDDGNRAYLAADFGLRILDVSEVQARTPNPQVRDVARLTWEPLSIPQVALPVTIDGKPYLVEVDEFSRDEGTPPQAPEDRLPADNGPAVGAARIIDLSDERNPKVVSDLRLEVHQPENRAAIAGDPGATGNANTQGYAGHYCGVPQRDDPGVVACSFIASGLRVFDIRDPLKPREIAYYVAPFGDKGGPSNWAMSAPTVIPSRREIWYSDGYSGFYSVRVSQDAWPTGVAGASARCTDRRRFAFRLHRDRGARVVRVIVYVNGKRRLSRRGRSLRRIAIRPLSRGRHVVRIVSTQSNGWERVSRRVYRDCTKGPPRTLRRRAR